MPTHAHIHTDVHKRANKHPNQSMTAQSGIPTTWVEAWSDKLPISFESERMDDIKWHSVCVKLFAPQAI